MKTTKLTTCNPQIRVILIDYKNFKDNLKLMQEYFKKEREYMSEMHKDGLIEFLMKV